MSEKADFLLSVDEDIVYLIHQMKQLVGLRICVAII